MATLVLTTVGSIVGGPIGGALGAIIGQRIDQQLLAPKGRRGPRLNELAVQSSSYGSPLPKIFGKARVAGSVIWATDLKETRRKVSNGKGQPKTTVYSYSASFAVALSARPITGIGRIWADGNLLRGASGDFKTPTGFRLHSGGEGQLLDPLIASAEGMDSTPAYRGLAYAVLEDFELGDYGNRVPSLSFEILADPGDVAVGAILSELAGADCIADDETAITGFIATGDSVRAVAETLAPLFPFSAYDDGQMLRLETVPSAYDGIDADALGGGETPRLAMERRSQSLLPRTVAIAHYEPVRDYQQGQQHVGAIDGARMLRLDMPVVLDGQRVKGLALAALQRIRVQRETAKIALPWRYLDLRPGQRLSLPGDARAWCVTGASWSRAALEVDLVRLASPSPHIVASDPGRPVGQPDRVHGPTTFHLLDLPPLDDEIATAPRVVVAAAGVSPGWRKAALLRSLDGGSSWQEAGGTAAPAVIGTALTALPAASPALFDRANSVDIALLDDGMELAGATHPLLLAGANAAILGSELIQFSESEPLGEGVFRLSGFLRGRRSTEWAISIHSVGDPFTLVERDALALIDVPAGTSSVRVIASGVGDAVPLQRSLDMTGQALLPPSPVHLVAERQTDGSTVIRWMRRSRNGWRWIDGTDAPLVEEAEHYLVSMSPDSGIARTFECEEAQLVYNHAARLADIAAGAANMAVTVIQTGTHGLSRPAIITFPLA